MTTNTQNYNRFSYVLNNPLKYTDPSGYNYLIDGMPVSEHTFFRYMRNMSGTEMIFDMVGSWDFTLAIRSTVKNYIVTESTAHVFANVYLDANSLGFYATSNNNRTNLWGAHNTSNFHLLYNLKPVSTFFDGDILNGFFIFEEIISKGKIITTEDFRRAVRMSGGVSLTGDKFYSKDGVLLWDTKMEGEPNRVFVFEPQGKNQTFVGIVKAYSNPNDPSGLYSRMRQGSVEYNFGNPNLNSNNLFVFEKTSVWTDLKAAFHFAGEGFVSGYLGAKSGNDGLENHYNMIFTARDYWLDTYSVKTFQSWW